MKKRLYKEDLTSLMYWCGCLPIDWRLYNMQTLIFVVVKKTVYWQPLNSLYLGDFEKVISAWLQQKCFFRVTHVKKGLVSIRVPLNTAINTNQKVYVKTWFNLGNFLQRNSKPVKFCFSIALQSFSLILAWYAMVALKLYQDLLKGYVGYFLL